MRLRQIKPHQKGPLEKQWIRSAHRQRSQAGVNQDHEYCHSADKKHEREGSNNDAPASGSRNRSPSPTLLRHRNDQRGDDNKSALIPDHLRKKSSMQVKALARQTGRQMRSRKVKQRASTRNPCHSQRPRPKGRAGNTRAAATITRVLAKYSSLATAFRHRQSACRRAAIRPIESKYRCGHSVRSKMVRRIIRAMVALPVDAPRNRNNVRFVSVLFARNVQAACRTAHHRQPAMLTRFRGEADASSCINRQTR